MRRRNVRPVPARRLLAAALGAFTIIALAVAPALAHGSPRTSSVRAGSVEAVGAARVVRQSLGRAHARHAAVSALKVQVASPKVTRVAKVTKAATVETDAPEANDSDQGDQNTFDEGQQSEQDQPEANDGPDDQTGDQGQQGDQTDDQSGGNDQSGVNGGD